MDPFTAAGLAGFIAYVAAYALVQLDRLDGNGVAYSSINVVAAGLVLVSLYRDFNLASALIQVTWISLGLIGMLLRWSAPPGRPLPIAEQATNRLR